MEHLNGNRLIGKTVIVSGSGSGKTGYGIGQAIAVLFAGDVLETESEVNQSCPDCSSKCSTFLPTVAFLWAVFW